MSAMSVRGAKILKEDTEQDLLDLFRSFERKTGFSIDYINIDREDGESGETVITGIKFNCVVK